MFAANRFTQQYSMSLSFSQLNLLQLSYVTLPGLWFLLDFTGLNSLLFTTPVHQYINLQCIAIFCGCLDEGLTSFVWVLARWCRQLGNPTYNFLSNIIKYLKSKHSFYQELMIKYQIGSWSRSTRQSRCCIFLWKYSSYTVFEKNAVCCPVHSNWHSSFICMLTFHIISYITPKIVSLIFLWYRTF